MCRDVLQSSSLYYPAKHKLSALSRCPRHQTASRLPSPRCWVTFAKVGMAVCPVPGLSLSSRLFVHLSLCLWCLPGSLFCPSVQLSFSVLNSSMKQWNLQASSKCAASVWETRLVLLSVLFGWAVMLNQSLSCWGLFWLKAYKVQRFYYC